MEALILGGIFGLGISFAFSKVAEQYLTQKNNAQDQSLVNSLLPWQQQYAQAWDINIVPQIMRTKDKF